MGSRPKVAVYLLTTLALGCALWATGGAGLLLSSDRVFAVPTIGGLAALGAVLSWLGRWDAVDYLADKLPVVGLIGTVLGVLLTVHGITTIDDSTRMQIFLGVSESLVANLLGIAGYGWLSLLHRVCK